MMSTCGGLAGAAGGGRGSERVGVGAARARGAGGAGAGKAGETRARAANGGPCRSASGEGPELEVELDGSAPSSLPPPGLAVVAALPTLPSLFGLLARWSTSIELPPVEGELLEDDDEADECE